MKFSTKNLKTWVEIDQRAIHSNLRSIQRHLDNKILVMLIIKANAYGHGLQEVGHILKKEKNIIIGVDSLDEALLLKKNKTRTPIIILGYIPREQLQYAIHSGFHISIYSKELHNIINSLTAKQKFKNTHIHLKIETGTNRLGIQEKDLEKMQFNYPIEGIYTHFAETENPKSRFYQKQLRGLIHALVILEKKEIRPRYLHAAATAALMQFPKTHGNLVRLGIGLYGLWPSREIQKILQHKIVLRSALTWKTRIAQVKHITKKESVGYDRAFRARSPKTIAILPIGYYDGYDRGLSNKGEVIVGGKKAKVIGNVCMNMTMIDVTGLKAKEGDDVILLGKQKSAETTADTIAQILGTINYEVVTRINPLIPRIVR